MAQSARRRLCLLGPARVDQIQKPRAVPRFRSRRTVGLLGYLAAEQRPVARDHLALLFWPDEASSKGRANLSRELHNLAQILPDCWDLDRQSVAFVPSASTWVDLYHLQRLEAQERWAEAADLLRGEFLEGVNLDDNPEFENWLLGERDRWRARGEAVLSRVIEAYTRHGKYTDAQRQAQRLLQLAPWDEAAHRHSMRLLAWTGQRGAALRQYESCKRALREELDVEPSEETAALYQQIQAGQLDRAPQLPAFLTEERARPEIERALFVGREGELARLDAFIDAVLVGQSRAVFITGGPGRGKTALLDAFAQRAMERHPNLLVAGGKCNAYSGVGDPYLPFRDVMALLTGDVEGRWQVGAITADHARRLWAAFPLVVQDMLNLGPDLLDVFVPGAALLSLALATGQDSAPWFPGLREHIGRKAATRTTTVEQGQLFQQVTTVLRTVAQKQPLLLILDDIQWADTATISLLFHLGRRLADENSRILIACAYRPEEVALGPPLPTLRAAGGPVAPAESPASGTGQKERHPLAKVLSEFRRNFGDVWVDLGRSEETEQRSFVDALLDAEPNRLDTGFRAALFDRTAGHPLFTVELLRTMQDRNDLVRDADGVWTEGPALDWEVLPARVEAVIEERVDRLDAELLDLLTIASVEGEVFTANVVAEVQNVPERLTLRRLSQDLERRHRLVREQEEVETSQSRLSRFRFGHVLFQNFLYQRLGLGERRLLHGSIAVALEKLHSGQLDTMAVQLAHHFQQAGEHERAFHYFSLAAERASRVYASDDAIAHYSSAIELADRVSPDVVSLAKLQRGRGLASERLGEFDQARTDYTTALQMARAAGTHEVEKVEWRALVDLGKLWASRDYGQARGYFEAALELARSLGEPASLAVSLNWMGNWYANDDDPRRAAVYHQEALDILENLGNRRALANTLDHLGLANLLGGDLVSSVPLFNRAIALFRELDDRPRLAASLSGRGSNYSMLVLLTTVPANPSPDPTLGLNEALRIAAEINLAPEEAWARYSLGMVHTIYGRFGHALKAILDSLHIASEIEHREFVVGSQFALGVLYAELFALDRARDHLEGALTLAGELCSPTWVHIVSGALAGIYMMLDDHNSAQTCLERVISAQTPMDTIGKRCCWLRQAELALALGDAARALDITERLIASAPGLSSGRVVTFLWKLKAEAMAATGRTDDAFSLLYAAIENVHASGERFLLWRLHASLGRLCRTMGRQEAAETELSAARGLIDELAATVADETLRGQFRQGAYGTLLAPG